MEMAVTIPDDLFDSALRFAHRSKRSHSRLVCDVLREYLAHHAPERASAEIGEMQDAFVSCAARRILEQSEW
jgi:metal-responsive CopG/Arc/MetJ family transcriptional regulator